MFILFFLFTVLLGLYLLSFFPKDLPVPVKLAFVYIVGTIFLTILFFLFYPLLPFSPYSLYLPFLLLTVFLFLKRKNIFDTARFFIYSTDTNTEFHLDKIGIATLFLTTAFSAFIFLKTVWYDLPFDQTLIMGKLWSDFGAHISLIRSFFTGYNFPPQYPLFAHAPIKYYFMFHFHVGLLEKLGLPLFAAIDIPSILSFSCLLFIIYAFGASLFKSRLTGVIAILMTVFNASFSWWYFVKNNFTSNLGLFFKRLIEQKEFAAFNPYDGSLVSGGFWNLNVYTNQRHLALSFSLLFLIIFIFIHERANKEKLNSAAYLILGVSAGLMALFHGVVLLIIGVLTPFFWLIEKQKKKFFYFVLPFFLVALPSLLYLRLGPHGAQTGIKFLPGYLTAYNFNAFNFLRYWALNLGLLILLLPLGFIKSKPAQKILLFLALPIFLIGNLFSFSVDIATNHKFFNFTVIVFNLYTAYFLSGFVCNKASGWHERGTPVERPQSERSEDEDVGRGWRVTGPAFAKFDLASASTKVSADKSAGKPALLVIFVFFLTISGIIDIFPIINDGYYGVPDPSHKSDILWIENNTAKNAVIANSYYLYHPASVAGRRIPLGWPYFSWSAGYDTETRVRDLTNLYLTTTKNDACYLIKKLDLDYISLNTIITDVNIKFDVDFWKKNFPLLLENPSSGFLLFEAKQTCSGK